MVKLTETKLELTSAGRGTFTAHAYEMNPTSVANSMQQEVERWLTKPISVTDLYQNGHKKMHTLHFTVKNEE